MSYFPVLVDLDKMPALVVGGGRVALRKVENLLEFDADITLISPEILPELQSYADSGKIKFQKRIYQKGDADQFKIVFSAVDDLSVPEMLKADCDKNSAILNAADVPEYCDFIMPATIRRGPLTVSVASQGEAPFFVRSMRQKIDKLLSPHLKDTAELAAQFRKLLYERDVYDKTEIREKLISEFLQTDWDKIMSEQGRFIAETHLKTMFENYPRK